MVFHQFSLKMLVPLSAILLLSFFSCCLMMAAFITAIHKTRAFDNVVHSKLIFKLSTFGISGNLLSWIAAFLNEHFQCVVVEHCNSERLPVLSSISQGTVLGPVIFILFIDDIGIICSGSVAHKLFADDMKL